MTRTSNLGLSIILFLMAGVFGLFALAMLGQTQTMTLPAVHQSSAVTIDWLRPDQVHMPSNLTIAGHAAKHNGETEKIYKLLLEGQCVEVAMFCGGSEAEKMYVCVDPVTGLVGILLQFGDEITTGYFSRNSNNLGNRIDREKWEVCAWPN